MGFFSDLKDDLSQAVNELMPEEGAEEAEAKKNAEAVVHWLSPPPLPALAELIYPEGVLPATVLITLDDIRRAWLPAALVGRLAETDRFAIPEVDVDLDVLDFSSSFFQATISFQIA